jgi:glycosyltransferase involved in cell wall biosynthesis
MVSICIPSYNNLELFKKCFNSVWEQTFTDFELIVSDDSTNNEIESFLRSHTDKNFKYFHHKSPLGSPSNWNFAIEQCHGKYIKILHHDDYFSSNHSLNLFMKAMESNPNAVFGFSQTWVNHVSDNSKFLHKQSKNQLNRIKTDPEFLFYRNVIGAPSAIIFKNIKDLTFNASYKWLVDVEFYIRVLKKYSNFVQIQEPLVTTNHGVEGQITGELLEQKQIILQENLNLFANLAQQNINPKSALLFFEELFDTYHIENYEELNLICSIPNNIQIFIKKVFVSKNQNKLLKQVIKRLLTSRYNKKTFNIERF